MLEQIKNFINSPMSADVVHALILVVAGFVVAKMVSTGLTRATQKHLDTHQVMIVRRGSYYLILVLFLITALHHLGFNLSVLLGAAGILTVAIGFASQTSASNIISGLFLITERPFTVGDVITVGATTGEVIAIDLLSVKLRTFDNLFVRIPNETLIKSEVINMTRFPIRRMDLMLGVAYHEDIKRVHKVLEEVAEANPLCLEEPRPLFIFRGFGESSLDIQFSVWAKRENFLDLKNSIQIEIKEAFDANGIEIPFPQRSLTPGTEPILVKILAEEGVTPPSGGQR